MSPRYLFPCENCQYSFELVARQAGQNLECPKCKQEMEAPVLGKMRQLELVGDSEAKPSRPESGRGLKNYLFVCGLATAILAGAAGGWLYHYSTAMIFDYDVSEIMDEYDIWVDGLSPAQVVDEYENSNVDQGLGDWQELPATSSTKQGRILQGFSYGLMALAGVGLLVLLGSFFVRR